MVPTAPTVIQLRDLVDDVLQAAGWPRFCPATPGRTLRGGYELCCTRTRLVHATTGAIRLRHHPYDANTSAAAVHGYWQTLLASPRCRNLHIVAEVASGRYKGLTIWIATRPIWDRQVGAA